MASNSGNGNGFGRYAQAAPLVLPLNFEEEASISSINEDYNASGLALGEEELVCSHCGSRVCEHTKVPKDFLEELEVHQESNQKIPETTADPPAREEADVVCGNELQLEEEDAHIDDNNQEQLTLVDIVDNRVETGAKTAEKTKHKGDGGGTDEVTKAEEEAGDVGKEQHYLGVSVFHLEKFFMMEIFNAGFSRDATIYEIEDLAGPPGLIRQKGLNVRCPMDGEMGAAYVHCLGGSGFRAGPATHMLSYTWGYSIGDIVDTLVDFCEHNNLDKKKTYFWICCLCVNQHRVAEQQKATVPTAHFLDTFGQRVSKIGNIVCMMSPWDDPLYLKRIWCIFEISQGFTNRECAVMVAMPPKDKLSLIQKLFLQNSARPGKLKTGPSEKMERALCAIKVEAAKASQEADRLQILALINKQAGGYDSTNARVKNHLKESLNNILLDLGMQCTTFVNEQNRTESHTVLNTITSTLHDLAISKAKNMGFDKEAACAGDATEAECTVEIDTSVLIPRPLGGMASRRFKAAAAKCDTKTADTPLSPKADTIVPQISIPRTQILDINPAVPVAKQVGDVEQQTSLPAQAVDLTDEATGGDTRNFGDTHNLREVEVLVQHSKRLILAVIILAVVVAFMGVLSTIQTLIS